MELRLKPLLVRDRSLVKISDHIHRLMRKTDDADSVAFGDVKYEMLALWVAKVFRMDVLACPTCTGVLSEPLASFHQLMDISFRSIDGCDQDFPTLGIEPFKTEN